MTIFDKLLKGCAGICLFHLVFVAVQANADDDLELLNTNTSFEDAFAGWGQYINAEASAIFEIDKDAFEGDQSALINIAKVSGTNWHVGLSQDGLSLEMTEQYTVDFFAKADANRIISLELKRSPGLGDWEGITEKDINISDEWAEYSHTFVCPRDYEQGALMAIWLGQVKGEVWIDGLRLYWGEKQDHEDTVIPKSVAADGKLAAKWAAIKTTNYRHSDNAFESSE